MKTLIISIIVIAILLGICWILSLIRKDNQRRWTNLILPLIILLLFVGLFVGGSISRSHIKSELATMQDDIDHRASDKSKTLVRLDELERKNKDLSHIIGRDIEIESWIDALRSK